MEIRIKGEKGIKGKQREKREIPGRAEEENQNMGEIKEIEN